MVFPMVYRSCIPHKPYLETSIFVDFSMIYTYYKPYKPYKTYKPYKPYLPTHPSNTYAWSTLTRSTRRTRRTRPAGCPHAIAHEASLTEELVHLSGFLLDEGRSEVVGGSTGRVSNGDIRRKCLNGGIAIINVGFLQCHNPPIKLMVVLFDQGTIIIMM